MKLCDTVAGCVLLITTFLRTHAHDDSQHKAAEVFLREYMPFNDAEALAHEFIHENVHLALEARQNSTWASAVPWNIFLNYVLPYASLDERRDPWRPRFWAQLGPLVAQHNISSLADAVQMLNREIWPLWGVVFRAEQTPKIMSPFQVLEAGYASCTGLSIILVAALRTVGVPARVTGTPEWVQQSGNHDWVEVLLDDGSWSYIGAAEPGPFNKTWFSELATHQIPGSLHHGIFTTSWEPTTNDTHFPMSWAPASEQDAINGWDVTYNYVVGSSFTAER